MLVVCSAHYHARACLLAHTRSLNAHDGGEQHKLESLVLQKTVMKKKNTQADATQTMAHPHTVFVCVCVSVEAVRSGFLWRRWLSDDDDDDADDFPFMLQVLFLLFVFVTDVRSIFIFAAKLLPAICVRERPSQSPHSLTC